MQMFELILITFPPLIFLMPLGILAAAVLGFSRLPKPSRSSKNLWPIEESMYGLQIMVRYSTGMHHNRSHGSE
jgi:hypothetical protein